MPQKTQTSPPTKSDIKSQATAVRISLKSNVQVCE